MGGDGGSIPKRAELVKTSKKGEQIDKDMERNAKWSHCAITQRELIRPIVSCDLGRLYNKESVLEYLLDKSICDSVSHIKSMKDVTVLNLTENVGYDKECRKLAGHFDTMASKFTCPVVGIEMNGKYRFCFIRTCGCVMSERALKEVSAETCHKCGKPYSSDDVIVINGNKEDVKRQETKMEERREKAKAAKKLRKASKEHATADDNTKLEVTDKKSAAGFVNMDKNGTLSAKKRKEATTESLPNKKQKAKIPDVEPALNNKSVAKDPNASKVFKSLFTSSETAKKRPRHKVSNWVTYNPYHL
eukprot:gene5646-6342_t